jgi:hypothetical protein
VRRSPVVMICLLELAMNFSSARFGDAKQLDVFCTRWRSISYKYFLWIRIERKQNREMLGQNTFDMHEENI